MIENRAPGTIWGLRLEDLGIYVRTEVNDHVLIVGPDWVGKQSAIIVSRKDARLLAKRINECLDATVKR